MRRLAIAAALSAGLAVPALAQPASQELRQAAEQIGKQYDQNYNAKNAAGMASLYTSDGTFVGFGPLVQGHEALQKYYQGRFQAGVGEHVTTIRDVRTVGDAGYGVGQFSVMISGPNGKTPLHGHVLAIYQHEGDSWKIRLLMANIIPNK